MQGWRWPKQKWISISVAMVCLANGAFIHGQGVAGPLVPAVERQQKEAAGETGPPGFRFREIDSHVLDQLGLDELQTRLVAEFRRSFSDWTAEQIEADARAQGLIKLSRHIEQASQYALLEERQQKEAQTLLERSSTTVDSPAEVDMASQLDIARQRWPVVQQQLQLVHDRCSILTRNETILRDFVQDDATLIDFMLAKAEKWTAENEIKMLQAELKKVELQMDRLPKLVRQQQQQLALASAVSNESTHTAPIPVSGELSPDSRKNFSGTNDLIPRDELLPREKNAKNGAGDGPYERRGGRDRGARALTDKVDRESLVLRREFIQRQASITSRQLAKIEEKEHALREKIELVGLTEANQLMLLEAYRKLPEEAKFRIQTVEYENEIKSASVEMLGFEERLSMRKRRWYDEAGIDEWEVADDPKITLPDDLAEIQAIVNEYRGLHQELLQLSAEREKLLHATREFRVFLSSNLLWVQNAEAVSGRDIQKSWQGLIQLAIPQPWIELGAGLGAQMVQRPVEVMAFVFGFVALQLGARRLSTAKRKPRGDMP